MLGFGTQFLDGELDGWPDMIIANGHLMDETDLGVPYQMRPQYFRNEGNAAFRRIAGERAGEFLRAAAAGTRPGHLGLESGRAGGLCHHVSRSPGGTGH